MYSLLHRPDGRSPEPRTDAQVRTRDHLTSQCRILFVVGQMGSGGMEQQICYLLQGMDRRRYRPALVVWNLSESDANVSKLRALGVPVWGYPESVSSCQKLYALTRLARRLAPEVIHSYSFYTNFAAFWAGVATGAVAVGSVRGQLNLDNLLRTRPVLGRLSASLPRHQISNSYRAAVGISSRGKWLAPGRLAVVPNRLDLARFRTDPIPEDPPHSILGIGSLVRVKRWDRLLHLGRELKRRRVAAVIQIAGDGPLRGELETLARDLGIAETARFLGRRDDIPELIARARLLVHTSDAEGTPNAVMEALASGRPVVATDAGDVGRIIGDGKTGFVVPPEDPQLLLERVLEVLADTALAIRMAKAARDYASREFGLAGLVEDTFEAYRSAGWKDS